MGPIDAKVYGKIIKRITFVKYDFFFDFHVPKFENYLACGVFNHNSSKTYSGAAEDVFYALGNHPYKKIQVPNEGWVVSPSYKQQVEGVQATILKLLPAKSIKDKNYVKSEVINSIWIIPHGFPLDTPKEKCSKITFKSCDAGEREFAGAAKRWIHFDEEPPRGIWNEALARIGAGMPLDIWLTMTPIFENSGKKVGMTWTYRELYRKRDNKRIFCLGVGIEDNIYLSKEQIEEQKRKYHGAEYDIRIKGEFKLLAGNQVFNPEKLEAMEHYITEPQAVGNLELDSHGNVKFVENNRGLVRIWEFPQKDTAYAVGGDVGLGVGGDPSCAQVLSMDNVDQCAELTGQVNPELFGKLSMWLAQYYNQAWLGIEANSFGIAAIDSIKKSYAKLYYRYRVDHRSDTKTKQIGWWTDTKTKPIMISDMARALNDGSVIIRSNMALDEFATYVIGSDGNANAELGCHDDRVVALMIALQVRKRFYQAGNSTTSTHAPEFKPASSAGGY
jgi:phage terminase large subunit-like protein